VEGRKRMYEIVFYDSEDGKCPIQEFLDSLEPKLLAKTLRTIDLLELYFFFAGRKVVLTNGFVKKSQKTTKTEKELAKKYKTDYERRYGNEQL
jgi:phage-related protein